MKKLLLLFALLLSGWVDAQDFYYYKNQKISLKPSLDKILVKYTNESSPNERQDPLTRYQKIKLSDSLKLKHDSTLSFLSIKEKITGSEHKEILKNIRKESAIAMASPVYIHEDGFVQAFTDEFIIKLKPSASLSFIEGLLKANKCMVYKKDKYTSETYTIRVHKSSEKNTLDLANLFYESGFVEYSEPNFLYIVKPLSNDEYYPNQWALNNTGQNGNPNSDINAEEAWKITTGSSNVKVAIIDTGVDLNHPDLIANLLPGYDATGNGGNGNYSNVEWHGTACAGVVAAVGNNGIGVAGVAYSCKIIPVRHCYNNVFQAAWSADAINWAWANGADVLSNSWKIGYSSAVDNAIANAVTQGRNNLGAAVLFASGNDDASSVSYPSSNSNTISVGAMSMCSERKNTGLFNQSCDQENGWGSNYGSGLDVIAPGVSIYTTYISAPSSLDYMTNFNGTSAATPHAAGVMALIFSANNCLTLSKARQILELTCSKVNVYCYNNGSAHPNGTWNQEVGYGCVNALKAVQSAQTTAVNSYTSVGGTDLGATDYYTMSIVGTCVLPAAGYIVKRHEVQKTVTFPNTVFPSIQATSNGLSAANPNQGNNYADVISFNSTSATFRTYVYEVYNTSGQFLGWQPAAPANVVFSYTVLTNGSPAISGVTSVCANAANSTFSTQTVAGGSYSWSISPTSAGVITGSGNTATVDWNNTSSGTATINVIVNGSCGSYTSSHNVSLVPVPITPTIAGPTLFCTNPPTQMYNVPVGNTPGATYTWSFPSSVGTFVGSNIGQTATIDFNNNVTNGGGTLALTVSNACGSKTSGISLNINSSVPATPYLYGIPSSVCNNTNTNITLNYMSSSTSYDILPTNAVNWNNTTYGPYGSINIDWENSFTGAVTIKARTRNGCGFSAYSPTYSVNVVQGLHISGPKEVCNLSPEVIYYPGQMVGGAAWTINPSTAGTGSLYGPYGAYKINWADNYTGNATLNLTYSGMACAVPAFNVLVKPNLCEPVMREGVIVAEESADLTATLNASIRPNPSNSFATLEISNIISENSNVEIYDMKGISVYKNEHFSSGTALEFGHNLQPGLYTVIVRSNNEQKVLKFIKTH